jgi:hypothetical protein
MLRVRCIISRRSEGSMLFRDTRHAFDCQTCAHTGGPCMEALWLARRIMQALETRKDRLPEGVELASQARFTGCGRSCAVRLQMTAETVSLDCGGVGGGPALARVSASTQAGADKAAAALA